MNIRDAWKYSTLGLLAVLAVGFSFPQAFAHVTNSTAHMLQHIYEIVTGINTKVDQIKAKTDNLPTDPASQSALEATAFTQIQTERLNVNSRVDCTSDEDFLIHYLGSGDATVSHGEGGIAFNGDPDTALRSFTIGSSAGETITIEERTFAFVTLQTTEGATASCT